MNALERLWRQSQSLGDFAQAYFAHLKDVLDGIGVEPLNRLADELRQARADGTVVFVAGNGGSATTATSIANDLGLDVARKTGTGQPFRMMALTDNVAALTAVANDVGYESVFVNQLKTHYRAGDRLIVISASGDSPNVVKAAEWVRARGGRVIGFLGFTGGRLRALCDLAVHVRTEPGEYGPVEDAHLVISHVLAHWFQHELKA